MGVAKTCHDKLTSVLIVDSVLRETIHLRRNGLQNNFQSSYEHKTTGGTWIRATIFLLCTQKKLNYAIHIPAIFVQWCDRKLSKYSEKCAIHTHSLELCMWLFDFSSVISKILHKELRTGAEIHRGTQRKGTC